MRAAPPPPKTLQQRADHFLGTYGQLVIRAGLTRSKWGLTRSRAARQHALDFVKWAEAEAVDPILMAQMRFQSSGWRYVPIDKLKPSPKWLANYRAWAATRIRQATCELIDFEDLRRPSHLSELYKATMRGTPELCMEASWEISRGYHPDSKWCVICTLRDPCAALAAR